ncbi:MAG: diguanylate cyclase, partial [Gemmatimonadetes bacterium]|nr:GGDEF domain-containing protein [Gemmatimonadota bacterium]NIR39546.1 GGDEF domain-containing protein [Actinomycetota bacterium]NIT88259.1 GGDEF domain-containing protein [Gemmatimonadota bacterium]NIU77692.1 diguanylate cyclase [Gammaproteobacteria bacterium]NIY40282.1 diguanylate cyclase [Gemmatimonadota bacterium]
EQELERASRYERPLSVLMMDIDRFKEFNDTFGHQAGDDVLAGMGEVLRDATRESDVPARYGGEEFIVILPDCDLQGAMDAAERIRARLSDEVFEGGAVTVSIGAAAHPGHGDSAMELIAAADVALYAAKEAGRDRVVAAGPGKKLPDGAPAGPERGKSRRRPRDG